MSYVKKPEIPKFSQMTPQMRDSRPICEQHGFPMLRINGRLQCVFEFLHDCIVHKQVVDVVQHGKTTYYVFEDGHELPLLCSCCGGSLSVDNLDEERKKMSGQQLERLYTDTNRLPNGLAVEELILMFLGEEGEKLVGLEVPVAFEVAVKLRHPVDCPRRGILQVKGHPSRKKSRLHKKRRHR
jgi:hypothetical protein